MQRGENMKTLMSLTLIIALAILLMAGCGQKQEETETVSQEAKQAEVMDTTRLDSAVTDSVPVGEAEPPADSM